MLFFRGHTKTTLSEKMKCDNEIITPSLPASMKFKKIKLCYDTEAPVDHQNDHHRLNFCGK